MKKKASDALIQNLVSGKISREEFEQLLLSLENQEEAVFLENSLREHFNSIMEDYEQKQQRVPGNAGDSKSS
jgi:hypothetical protein